MSGSPQIPADLKYIVIEVVEADPPDGVDGGKWFRYTIGHKSSPIVGIRAGTLNSVRRYAEEFAGNLNERLLLGFSAYRARRMQKENTS